MLNSRSRALSFISLYKMYLGSYYLVLTAWQASQKPPPVVCVYVCVLSMTNFLFYSPCKFWLIFSSCFLTFCSSYLAFYKHLKTSVSWRLRGWTCRYLFLLAEWFPYFLIHSLCLSLTILVHGATIL